MELPHLKKENRTFQQLRHNKKYSRKLGQMWSTCALDPEVSLRNVNVPVDFCRSRSLRDPRQHIIL
jgi:hypothetical protein